MAAAVKFDKPTRAEERRRRFFQLTMQRETVRDVMLILYDKAHERKPLDDWERELVETFQVQNW